MTAEIISPQSFRAGAPSKSGSRYLMRYLAANMCVVATLARLNGGLKSQVFPSAYVKIVIENRPVKIVGFPIKNCDVPLLCKRLP